MRRHISGLAGVFSLVLFAGCTSWHRNTDPNEAVARAKSGEIKVSRTDGSEIRLVSASIVGDSLIGISPVTGARTAIATNAIVSMETKSVSAGRTAALGGGVLIGVVAVTGLVALALILSALGGG